MPEYLYGFGYEDPGEMDYNRRKGEGWRSSTGVFIQAGSEAEALAWGRKISEAFLKHLHNDTNILWDKEDYASWIEREPKSCRWKHCLEFFQHVSAGQMPDFARMTSDACANWSELNKIRQFREKWESMVANRSHFHESGLVRAQNVPSLDHLSPTARAFLTQAGLPDSAAPCLTFTEVGKGLPRLWELFSPLPEWKPEEKKPVEPYLMLGSDGSGNPICADERDGAVVLLDHELLFDAKRLLKRITFVNSGVYQLAECLLEYNANLESPSLDKIRGIDAPAAAPRTFWFMEVNAAEAQTEPWWKFW